VWGFYQLKLVSDTPGPGFRVRSKHEGKRKRGCPSPLLHVRLARPGPRRPVVVRRARRLGRADPVVQEDPVVFPVAPVDPVAFLVVPVDPAAFPVDLAALVAFPADLAGPVAVPVDLVVRQASPSGPAFPLAARVGLAVPGALAARVDLVDPVARVDRVVPVALRGPTAVVPAARPLPRPSPRPGLRPPRGAVRRA